MRTKIVNTENVRGLLLAVTAIEERGAGEACLVVVDGSPGLGKSEATSYVAAQSSSIFVRAKREWTPNWMLGELLKAAGVQQIPRAFERKYSLLVETLAMQAKAAEDNGELFAVFIDEADYICRSDQMLSSIRDVSDFLEIPFILVGMGKVRDNLTKFPQVASRVGQYVRFNPLPASDTNAMIAGLCEVEVQADLVDLVHDKSNGYAREIKEAIAHIERHARRQNIESVGVADMRGQVLLNDRATSQPIHVREGA